MRKLIPFCQKTLEQLKLLVKYYQRDLLHINYTQSHYFWQSHYNAILQRGDIIPSVLKCEHASESPEGLHKIQIAGPHPQNFQVRSVGVELLSFLVMHILLVQEPHCSIVSYFILRGLTHR